MVGIPADIHGALVFSDRSQVGVRPADTRPGHTYDLSTAPAVDLTLPGRHWLIGVGYGEQIRLLDATGDKLYSLLHLASASYSRSWPRGRFTLSEAVSYGAEDYRTLTYLTSPTSTPGSTPSASMQPSPGTTTPGMQPPSGTPPPGTTPGGQIGAQGQTVNAVPRIQTVDVASTATTASVGYDTSRRTSLGLSFLYRIAGGRNELDQIVVPRERSQLGTVSLGYTLNHRDSLLFALYGGHVETSNGFENFFLNESVVWNHFVNRNLRAYVGAGWVEQLERAPSKEEWVFYPSLAVGLNGSLYSWRYQDVRLSIVFGSTFGPAYNQFTGEVLSTLTASTSLIAERGRTTLALTASGSQTIPSDPNLARVIGLSAVLTHHLGKLVDLSAGYATVVQLAQGAQYAQGRQWIAFVGVGLRAPPLLF
jgi:hypothetical protein